MARKIGGTNEWSEVGAPRTPLESLRPLLSEVSFNRRFGTNSDKIRGRECAGGSASCSFLTMSAHRQKYGAPTDNGAVGPAGDFTEASAGVAFELGFSGRNGRRFIEHDLRPLEFFRDAGDAESHGHEPHGEPALSCRRLGSKRRARDRRPMKTSERNQKRSAYCQAKSCRPATPLSFPLWLQWRQMDKMLAPRALFRASIS